MILTVTLNLALDVTYGVQHFERGTTTRVQTIGKRAGGKGVNVARTLQALGREVVVMGFAGGLTGDAARAELRASDLLDETEPIAGESRTTIIVSEADGSATGFSEPGPRVSGREWRRLLERFGSLLGAADAVVLSGSLPAGIPPTAYAQLLKAATARDVPGLVDAEGDALARALAQRPAVVKVNASELAGIHPGQGPLEGAAALRREGAGAAVISKGADGLLADTGSGVWRVDTPQRVRGNPTGAGDAAAAALVAGLVDGTPWPERLADAAALSAAAVAAPLAGAFDPDLYRRFKARTAAIPAGRPGRP